MNTRELLATNLVRLMDHHGHTIKTLNAKMPELSTGTIQRARVGSTNVELRHFDTIARLWERIGETGVGFCLDTCHAWAAGEQLVGAVERILAITGRIDLVHCNDSRDAAGSGADRHANFGTGQIDPELLVAVVSAAGAPVICETADDGRRADIAFLRRNCA